MAWRIEYSDTALRALRKIDRQTARGIVDYLGERAATSRDPRGVGKALTGPMGGLWRYRIGDYRVVPSISDAAVTVLVLRVGRRSSGYR